MPGRVTETQLEAHPGRWWFRQAEPAPDLRGLVKEYWEVEGALRPFEETILPHGWIELMVNLGPPHRVIGGASAGIWRRGWLSGLQEGAIRVESRRGTHLLSARLAPVGAVELLGPSVAHHANAVVDLETALGRGARALLQAVKEAPTPAARFDALEQFLRRHRGPARAPGFVRAAARAVEDRRGALRVSDLHAESGVSRKHLAVTFKRYLGVSLRGYAKIHRFAWAIEQLRSPRRIDWPQLALDAGYADQSHLVRDFRRIGGRAATALLARLAPDGISVWEDHR